MFIFLNLWDDRKNSRERTRFYLLFSLNTRILRMKKVYEKLEY